MTIEHIQNGDTGLAAREKINAAISAINESVGGGGAQPEDDTLTALAGLDTSANKMPYFTDNDVAALTTLSPFARTMLDNTTGADVLTTLGVSGYMRGLLYKVDAPSARVTLDAARFTHTHTAAQSNEDIIAGGYAMIGAPAYMVYIGGGGIKSPGFLATGAQLKWSAGSGGVDAGSPSGTWQLMGGVAGSTIGGGYAAENASLWIRIA
ncbi:hypothetical protein [Aeromonas sp. MR16]|uniref:hypothetical protein n=1 Tax=Aeromonas sp. MR16 TaxID=2923420 RepID=UPI001F4AA5B7|nr:hypothetical protein [Aeromonas sp. MR16]MCH7370039.1 hypothetical protein [Aeromonas sp. MR16]